MAMENPPFIGDFPIQTSSWFPGRWLDGSVFWLHHLDHIEPLHRRHFCYWGPLASWSGPCWCQISGRSHKWAAQPFGSRRRWVKRLAYTACPGNMFWLQYCNRYKWWCDNVWYVIYLYIYTWYVVWICLFFMMCFALHWKSLEGTMSLCYYQHSCPLSPGRCWCEAWSTLRWF